MALRGDVIVLCYHAVSPRWKADLAVSPLALERQVGLLLRRGYRASTFSDLIAQQPGGRRFAVTFDDSYRSVIEHAFPILARLGVVATVFVPTDFVGQERPMSWPGIDEWLGTPDEQELVPMGWNELRDLIRAGWEVGSHTCSHPRLTTLDARQLADELLRSKVTCEATLQVPCTAIAYPFGDHDGRVERAVEAAGYLAACTLPVRLAPSQAFAWPRVGVYSDNLGRFRLKASPLVRRVWASPAWRLVEALRRTGLEGAGAKDPGFPADN